MYIYNNTVSSATVTNIQILGIRTCTHTHTHNTHTHVITLAVILNSLAREIDDVIANDPTETSNIVYFFHMKNYL